MKELTKTSNIEVEATRSLSLTEANKVTAGALVGTALEWYDFFLFNAAAALVFNVQFFATGDAIAAALASFATYAIGSVVRPLGGVVFGILGDRFGRRNVLLATIIGVGVVTGLIGLLPTYAAIGIAAPILLLLLRVIQGLFVGGEWSGAMTIVVENVPLHLRARYAAIPQIASPIGTILSSGGFFLMTVLLSQDSFNAWGWRIPFLAAFPFLALAVFIRSRLQESPVFRELEESGEIVRNPVRTVFGQNWKQIIVGIGASLLGIGGFVLVSSFCVWYGVNVVGHPSSVMLFGTIVAALVQVPVLLVGGRIGGRIGASRVILIGGVASILLAVPGFVMFSSGSPALAVTAMAILLGTVTFSYSGAGAVLTGLFPAKIRYTGVGLAQNLAGAVTGFIPMLIIALMTGAGDHWWPAAALLAVVAFITALSAYLAPRLSVNLAGFKH